MRAILTSPTLLTLDRERGATGHERTAPEPTTLQLLVRTCLQDSNGDPLVAALLLEDRAKEHQAVLAELAMPYLADACYKAVTGRLAAIQGVAYEACSPTPEADTSGRLRRLGASLLEFRLPSGVLLCDAFASDIRQAATWYSSRAASLGKKGRWLAEVAVLVPRGRTAGAVLTEDRLRKMLEDA